MVLHLEKDDRTEKGPATLAPPAPYDPTAITTPEGCPSPLGWAEVLKAVHSQSTPWRVQAGGHTITGRTLGAGPPLYFLNGFAGTSDLYCLMVWLLRDEFRCVVFDYPAPTGTLTAEKLAEGLLAVADFHGDSPFSLFATSFGSVAALTAMSEAPTRIDRVILQAGFAHRGLSATERLLSGLGRFVPGTLASVPFWNTIEHANRQRSFPPFDQTRWMFFIENAGRTPIREVARRARLVASFDYRDRLGAIRQPVLLIRSEHEGLVSAGCVEELAHGLPHATVEMLHSTGPLAHLTHPHRLAKVVRTFLGERALEAAAAGSGCLDHAR
jgi:pimeloyl-ACP methyl ester carboxylesterase